MAFWAANAHRSIRSSTAIAKPSSTVLPSIHSSLSLRGISPLQVQYFVYGLVELFKAVNVSLDGILPVWHIKCTTQLCLVCRLAEGAHNPTNEDIK